MRSVILCEGFDDAWFLGYLIHKWSGEKWIYNSHEKSSLPVRGKNEKCEVYQRNSDKLDIWAVGGKDRFSEALGKIHHINNHYPENPYRNIVIVSDRDQGEIAETLSLFEQKLKVLGLYVKLENNNKNKVTYTTNDEHYDVYIYPIIIPFDVEGALETVLMTAISEDSKEDTYVVGQAKNYVSTVHESGNAGKYLKHQREIVKAEFSSVVSIINPTRSTATSDELLMLHNWEENEHIRDQFSLLKEVFIN